ncbi:DUF998 domain-containing protein [Actinokineospora sp. NBRC 105648]|uniref:DUF998 domain-containing protein n=1 Tax=Actinokineospora sp. NBRC 105648 TaxID=3032206 RepID=UPI0024A5EB67|nr:DUF998 domain-containing protein [Actinokineospora sp. NBRC 105648]GLZ40437.1 hypothetical protein Acsp05_40610 [Actinokineospora sp. NBRC 105648]
MSWDDCDRPAAITRSLLGYGLLAGPFYLVVGLVQALTRDGYDLLRHDLSLLANGPLGWIQVVNLVLSGLMTIAAAVGVRRALRGRPGGTWGSALIVGYGVGLVAAGAFTADPMNGFPAGTPAGPPAAPTPHGTLHFVAGGVGFLCLIAATFVLARHFAPGWSWYSRATGVAFLAGFAGIATGSDNPGVVLGFWVAVVLGWTWLAVLSLRLYRETPDPNRPRPAAEVTADHQPQGSA